MLQGVYLFTHLAYFLYFKELFHINQFVFQFFEGLELLKQLIIQKNFKYFIILLDFPLFIFIIFYFSKFYQRINLKIITFFICIIFLVSFRFNKPADDYIKTQGYVIGKYGLFANDVLYIMLSKKADFSIKYLSRYNKIIFRNNKQTAYKNIICIQVESLDANIVNYTYKGKYVVPFLHELTLRSIYYPYVLTYHFAGCTADTEFAVINSITPPEDIPFFALNKYEYPNSIVKRLMKSGFETVAFHNNKGQYFNRDKTFLKMGFNEFYDIKKMNLKEYGWGAKDEDVINFLEDKLKQQKPPFFYYVITMSSHPDYRNVRAYYNNDDYSDINAAEELRNYFNSMSYVDMVLKKIVSFVKDNAPDTYIFIFGDHRVFLYTKNYSFFKFKPAIFYYDAHSGEGGVPLFIITPDNQEYIENKAIASLLDIGPTILYASGINFEIMTGGLIY